MSNIKNKIKGILGIVRATLNFNFLKLRLRFQIMKYRFTLFLKQHYAKLKDSTKLINKDFLETMKQLNESLTVDVTSRSTIAISMAKGFFFLLTVNGFIFISIELA
jgi:hypothetical protein